MSSVKEEAKKLIERLPDQVTWDDIMYEFYVKKKNRNRHQSRRRRSHYPPRRS